VERTIEEVERLEGSPLQQKQLVLQFLQRHFVHEVGSELEPCAPGAFPPFVRATLTHALRTLADHLPFARIALRERVADSPALTEFAAFLHDTWRDLCRRVRSEVMDYPQRFTLIPRDHIVVVPGGRFREAYYWDRSTV
jgi:neutral trehalase